MNVPPIIHSLIEAVRLVRGKVDAMVARAVLERVNDALRTQRLQLTILADETADDVEHFQPYGLSFEPPAGAEAIALALGGTRAATVAICVQAPEERPTASGPRTGGLYTEGVWRVFIDEAGDVHLAAQAGMAKLARADRVETELNAIWQALATTSAVNGSPLVPGPRQAGATGADKVHGT